jgi:DNA-binding CsgD family transcriptional regulator
MNFDFTGEELESNKKGVLSPRQKQVLKTTAHGIRASSKSG